MNRNSARWSGVLGAVVAVALVLAPRPAAAWQVFCAEIFNPHGQTTPPAGNTTLPGPNGGQNEDGFYQVGACEIGATFKCPVPLDHPFFAGLCTCEPATAQGGVKLYDGCGDGFTGDQYLVPGTNAEVFPFSTILKYTEANGKTPAIEPMAGNRSPNGGGESVAVEWHLWGQGDLLVCDAGSADLANCVCCYVPPPPKDAPAAK
ncbi:MAG TPA: hypothetical protein VGK67_37135 [Myxococcales bacterium]|jgi:hypothetical protein